MTKLEELVDSLTLEAQIILTKILNDKDKENKQQLRDKCTINCTTKLSVEGYTISVNKDSVIPGSKILNQDHIQSNYPTLIKKCTKTIEVVDGDAVEMEPEVLKDEKAITTTPDTIKKGSVVVKCEK